MSLGGPHAAIGRGAIFLTGATGLVGGLLLKRLAQECPDRPVYVLVRNCDTASPLHHAHLLAGDIIQPGLGIPKHIYGELCRSIEVIVHCAAATRFTLPLDQARQVNVLGTANILQLARETRRLTLLLHISSTFIAGRRSGALHEAPLRDPAGWFSSYEQSKFEAEQLLHQQAADLPWVITRLSTLAGDSRTGRVSKFNYFHQLLRLIPANSFRVIPGTPDAPVDLVADDWVGDALLSLLRAVPPAGSFLHLCAGPSQSLPAQELLDLAFSLRSRDLPGSCIQPSFVSVAEFEKFAADLRRKGLAVRCRMAELLLLCLPHLEVHQHFMNDGANALLERSGVLPLRTREFLPRVIMSCFRQGPVVFPGAQQLKTFITLRNGAGQATATSQTAGSRLT